MEKKEFIKLIIRGDKMFIIEDNIKKLKYFYEACLENNFQRAAAKNFISASAISIYIRNLEEDLGCKLIVRTSKKFELTEKGERLFEICDKLFMDIYINDLKIRELL